MANVSQFAGQALLHQAGAYEPQRKSNYSIVIHGLDGADDLVLSIKATSVPEMKMNVGKIKYFNETMKYAASVTEFADQTIVFNDYIDRNTLDILAAWYRKVWNPGTGGIGWATDYKLTADIYLLPPSMPGGGVGAVTATPYGNRVWNLFGVWPSGLKSEQMDHEDDGGKPNLLTMTLQVDRAYPLSMAS